MLKSNFMPARDFWRAQAELCALRPRERTSDPHKRLSQACLRVFEGLLRRCGSAVARYRDKGTSSSSPGRCNVRPKSSWRSSPLALSYSHLVGDPQTEERIYQRVLTLLRRSQATEETSQFGDPAKGLGIPRESDYEGQQDLITEFSQDWGNRDSWRAQTKPCAHRDPGERHSDPTRD